MLSFLSSKLGIPEEFSWRRDGKHFVSDLKREISEDNVSNGAAALAYYLMLSIFPAMIFILTLLPYLPVENLDRAIMDLLKQGLPSEAATMFTGVVNEVANQKQGGLLSFGFLFTLWAASNGMIAIMQQLNITYKVKEARPFLKARATALGLTLLFGLLVMGAFGLIVFGGVIQSWLGSAWGWSQALLTFFSALRWGVIATTLLLGFALIYYKAPNVEQKFKFVTPGSFLGTFLLIVASLGFRFYVSNFGNYSASYGSIGAVIIMMLWLYLVGLSILLGSEVNALLEHYSAKGKQLGQKKEAA